MKEWLDLIKDENGQLSERILSDDCEKEFWRNYIKNSSNTLKEGYTLKIFEEVSEIIHKYKPETILEIGCGWGNYTFDLACVCDELTCLDISADNLNFVKSKAEKKGITNINYINEKFECFEMSKFNLIFAYNCFYRILDIKSVLEKINNNADIAIIGMNSNIERPSMSDLRFSGINIRKSKLSHYDLIRELKKLGILFEKKVLDINREYAFNSLKEAYEYEKRFISDKYYDENLFEEIISKHYVFNGKKFVQSHKIVSGILFWECKK